MIHAAIIGMGVWGQNLVTSVQGLSQDIQFVAGATRTPAKASDLAGPDADHVTGVSPRSRNCKEAS